MSYNDDDENGNKINYGHKSVEMRFPMPKITLRTQSRPTIHSLRHSITSKTIVIC